ncbi:ATP-dependent zinc protease [Polaromonas sp.]|nr:ATP-dependent zinc protease [Candidatus Saccharibacteria bacterium]
MPQLDTLGRTEEIQLPEIDIQGTHARVDTGAKTSAIWVSQADVSKGGLDVVFYGPGSPLYSGKTVHFEQFGTTIVASSNGMAQQRYKIRLLIVVGGRKIRAWFTLADRSTQVYPVLIGRNVLRSKFVVDVTKYSTALETKEKERTAALKKELSS